MLPGVGQSRNIAASPTSSVTPITFPWLTFISSRSREDVLQANLMTKDEARKIAAGIAKLPELLKRAQD